MENSRFIAKCLYGMEDVLAEELKSLNCKDIEKHNRMVSFQGDLESLYRVNLWSRIALRVLVPVTDFKITTQDDLYEGALGVEWDSYFTGDKTILIDGVVSSEIFGNSHFAALRIKDAVVDFFKEKYGTRPNVDKENPDVVINLHLMQNSVSLSIDSSGQSLHKRGWRVDQNEAPLNETLAAGLIAMTDWKGETDFLDPMCGSGTIAVEAALIARNIPPGSYRKKFAFQQWSDYDADLWKSLLDEAIKAQRPFMNRILASDKSPIAIKITNKNLKSARVDGIVKTLQCPMERLNPISEKGTMVINPPYGERIKPPEIKQLYKFTGSRLKKHFTGHTAWILTSNKEALREVGFRPTEKVRLYNGALECVYCRYDIYEGSRKITKSDGKPERGNRFDKRGKGKPGGGFRKGKEGGFRSSKGKPAFKKSDDKPAKDTFDAPKSEVKKTTAGRNLRSRRKKNDS